MNITQEVRDFAAKQNSAPETFIAAEEAEAGMAKMSELYNETGRELYMGAGGGSTIEEGADGAMVYASPVRSPVKPVTIRPAGSNRSIMIPALRDLERLRVFLATHPIHQPMLAVDPSRTPA